MQKPYTHVMKERFSITLDSDLLDWIESLIKEKVFSSRVHAVEFCVAQIKNIGIENIMLMRWGKNEIEPVFLSKNEIQTINRVSKKLNVDKDEALKILIYRGLEEISKDSQGSEKEPRNKEDKSRKVIID